MTARWGAPDERDIASAEMWREAKRQGADIWTRLEPHQQSMVNLRIEWVDHYEQENQ